MIMRIVAKAPATCLSIWSPARGGGMWTLPPGGPSKILRLVWKRLSPRIIRMPKKIRVVLDNLNTHTPAALYERYAPEKARALVQKLEFHYTPKHSSWLNMAEVEISVLTSQCIARRLGSRMLLEQEVTAWETKRNARKATIDWRFTIPNARDKLQRLYPVVPKGEA